MQFTAHIPWASQMLAQHLANRSARGGKSQSSPPVGAASSLEQSLSNGDGAGRMNDQVKFHHPIRGYQC